MDDLSHSQDDLTRLRSEYADRQRRFAGSDVYSHFNPANLFIIQQRQRQVLRLLRREGYYPLDGRRILEVGCGAGGVLLEYLTFGATPGHLHGVDLLPDRLADAHHLLPHAGLANADGQRLPYAGQSFDLVLQYTVHSSILDPVIKRNLSAEMVRVLRPNGLILWYDFWWNPTNPHTRGIRPGEIRALFPGCRCRFQRITLAPPLARRLVKVSWGLCLWLESLRIFNSHYLAAIRL